MEKLFYLAVALLAVGIQLIGVPYFAVGVGLGIGLRGIGDWLAEEKKQPPKSIDPSF